MKQSLLSHSLLLHAALWVGCLQADGFTIGTLVHTQQGFVPIEEITVGNNVVINSGKDFQAYSVTHVMSFMVDYFIKINVKNISFSAAPNQKFYSCNKSRWINAFELDVSDQLLCCNGVIVYVDAIEFVHEEQKMHALVVDTSHIFCVTDYSIIAHNVEPCSTGVVAVLSIACPPAAIAVAIGEVITLGVAGLIMYCAHKKIQKNKTKFDGCFSTDSALNGLQDSAMPKINGCYSSHVSVVDCIPPCGIVIESQTRINEIIPHEKPEVKDVGCAFPVEVIEVPFLCLQQVEEGEYERKQYDGPKYNRTEDWIKEHPFGQKIKKALERSDYTNQGKRAFKVVKKIENCDGFNKGDYVAVDAMHHDHLEVFNKRGKWVRVANFDGTKNDNKARQGEKDSRGSLK